MKEDLKYISEQVDISKFKNKRVLLAGSSGFLGNWFSDFFDYNDIEYLKYDIEDRSDICKPLDHLGAYNYVINCCLLYTYPRPRDS